MTVASLTLTAGSNFDEEIAGDAACSGYDRTTVTTTAALNNATLNVLPTFTPAAGTIFTIIQAGNITGTFNGLADGATFTANGIQFRINYTSTQVNLTVLGGTLAQTGQNTSWINFFATMLILSSTTGLLVLWRRKNLFGTISGY
jgi:LPXTG-motif cell wall-anchored protein